MLIDCHTHLDAFPDNEIARILERAEDQGVKLVISAGTTMDTSTRCIWLTNQFPMLFAAVGIHPMNLKGPVDNTVIDTLRHLAQSNNKVVAVSEIGLDFMEGAPDRAIQYQAFREQIRLARELNLPIVFHSREAHAETLRVLQEERAYEVGGVMHYFQGNLKTARQAIDLGFYLSIARPLIRLPHLQNLATILPLENIVLETDSAPQPFKAKRDRWTEPRHLKEIAAKLAILQDRSITEVEKITSQNAIDLLYSRHVEVRKHLLRTEDGAESYQPYRQQDTWKCPEE